MSNRKPIPKAKFGGEGVLLWPGRFRLRRRLPATFFSGSLEYGANPRPLRRHRRPTDGVEHDELSTRDFAPERIGNFASDRSTLSLL
jgi:hypothetical protein